MSDEYPTPPAPAPKVLWEGPDEPEPEALRPAQPARAAAKKRGMFVPAWALSGVAVVAAAAIGFGAGNLTADQGSSSPSSSASAFPGRTGQNPFGGFGNRGGTQNGGSSQNGGTSGGNSTPSVPSTPNAPSTPSTASAYMGVSVSDNTNGQGAVIGTVATGSPAEAAGLQSGDVVTAIDGNAVANASALRTAVLGHNPGDSVSVNYTRNGTSATAKVMLGTRTATPSN